MVKLINDIKKLLETFTEYTKDPTVFLRIICSCSVICFSIQLELENKFKDFLKQSYDTTKSLENSLKNKNVTLQKLIIKDFDTEQIWQQLELQNQTVYDNLQQEICSYNTEFNSISNENQKPKDRKKSVRFIDNDTDSEEQEEKNEENIRNRKNLSDTVNDDDVSDTELTDLEETSVNSEAEKENFSENFKNQSDNSENDKTIDEKKKLKSSLEERRERLDKRVQKLEEEALTEKPWQLKGEITAKKRPQNSLLEEILEFDLSSRPAPIITEEAALKLEDIIIRRIQNKAWDDVEKKIKPVNKPLEYTTELVLDQQKSKLSLAQIYENEYLKRREAVNPETKNQKNESVEHKQLKILLDTLFRKLDILTNFHVTPIPPTPEVKILTNLPAIELEEAIPTVVSEASLLAPEEIQSKRKGDLIGKEERTATDKKRERRKKKIKQRQKQKKQNENDENSKKLKPGMRTKFSKEKTIKELKNIAKNKLNIQESTTGIQNLRSSKQFFERLQDTVSSKIDTKRRKKNINVDAKRIKL
ncbi:hypothetical protein PGB90_010497 [Kerria lacca]